MVTRMATLPRPPTLKEIVMQSLLGWREPHDTLVDADDDRPTEIPEPRDTMVSVVFFDRTSPPRNA
jgi:hypothetical protein